MLKIALRDAREHWVRFLMSVMAVVLATAFVAATFSFTAMLGDSIAEISDSTLTADVYVRGAPLEGDDIPATFGPAINGPVPIMAVDLIESVDGVDFAAPSLFGMAMLVGSDGKAVSNAGAPTLGGTLVAGIDTFAVVEGRMPEAADEIVLQAETLELAGFSVGDTATVQLGEAATFTATIVGEVESEWSLMGATFVFVSEQAGLAAYAPTGLVPSIGVKLAPGAHTNTVMADISDLLGENVEVLDRDTIREESKSATASAMGFIETFMLIFAFIAFFAGSFLIANTFSMLVRQRQREFALLRAVGASPGQVIQSLLIQAGIIGLLGALLGIGAGILLVIGLQQIFASMNIPMEGSAVLPPARMILIVVLAMAFTCVASLMPARKAAATAPVEAMRPEDPKPERATVLRAIISAVMVAGGLAALWMAVTKEDAVWLGVGAAGILLGMLGLGPVIVPPVLGLLALPLRVFRPIGKLARGNVLRSPKRTSATAAALTIGMALVSAVAVLAASATESTRSIIDNQMRADYYVGSQRSTVPNNIEDQVRALASVTGVTPVDFGIVRSVEPEGDLTISAMSQQGYDEMLTVPIVEGAPVRSDGELVITESLRDVDGVAVGDTLTFAVPAVGNVEMKVVGVTNDSFMFTQLYALTSAYERLVPAESQSILFLLVNSAGDLDRTRADLENVVADLPLIQVLDRDELAEKTIGTISTMMNVLYALLGLSLVIAVLSIVNTLAMAVMERTREIGLMRAVGLGGGQLTGMIMIESVLTALFGTVMGMLIGVGLGATLPSILGDLGLNTLSIPWGALGIVLAGTVLVGVLAAVWPSIRALRLPVLDAVASE